MCRVRLYRECAYRLRGRSRQRDGLLLLLLLLALNGAVGRRQLWVLCAAALDPALEQRVSGLDLGHPAGNPGQGGQGQLA